MSHSFQNGFLSYAQEQLPRLLSLMDRNFFSDSAGCFDRNYWHFKTSDFPSASQQMGAQSIALLFSNSKSNYYKDSYLQKLIELSIHFTDKIQKKDGTFDEWYFNERGWAGPTAYLVHSYSRIYFLCSDSLSEEARSKLLNIIKKGSRALLKGNEQNIISNHIAIAATALYEAWEITKEAHFKEKAQKLLEELIENTNKEGWSNEYNAPDIGYQTATLSFLSYIHERTGDQYLEDFAKKSLNFISYFVMPNGEIANTASSRYTVTHFFRAYEYWKKFSQEASRISHIIKLSSPEPLIHQHEDHYFIYRLLELLEATNLNDENHQPEVFEIPSERASTFSKDFSDAGIMIKSSPNYYWIIGLNQGLSVYGWSRDFNKSLIDQGVVIKDEKNNIFISNEPTERKLEKPTHNEVSSNFWLKRHNPKYFSPFTFLFFRLFFALFANNQSLAELFKDKIKTMLIKPHHDTFINVTRSLFFQDDGSLKVINILSSKKKLKGKYYCHGQYNYKFVPQSNYFRETDLENFQQNIGKLNNTTKQQIEYLLKCADS